MRKAFGLLLFALFYLVAPAYADNSYQRVHLSAAAQQYSDNDMITMEFSAHFEHKKSAVVAEQINRQMNWALQQLKAVKGVSKKTQKYQIVPVYKKERLLKWRGEQVLQLSGSSMDTLGKLAAKLLQKLQINKQYFSLSFSKRQALENRLIKQALESLKKRALIVQESFSAKNYRLVNLNINTSMPAPVYTLGYRAKSMAARAFDKPANVAAEAGQTKITVSVNGEIELLF